MAANDRGNRKSDMALFNANSISRSSESSRSTKSKNAQYVELSDGEIEVLNKDDLNDEDYEQRSDGGTTSATRSKSSSKKPKYEHMSREALLGLIKVKDDAHAQVKHKRAGERKERDHEKKQRVQLKKENKEHLQTIEDLERKCRELRRVNIEQQQTFDTALEEKTEQFADAQKDWLDKVEESTYHALPDNVLKEKFHELWTRCREWIKEYYKPQTSPESRPFLHAMIARCTSDQQSSDKSLLVSKLDSGDAVTLRAMGFAWLTREMLQCFFEGPFFASGRGRRTLEEFYRLCTQKNPKKAHAWRAETVRLIRDNQGVRPLELRSESLRSEDLNALCSSLTKKITAGDYSVVLRETSTEDHTKRQTALDEICRGFCLLALELWCQKSVIVVVDDATLLEEVFSISSTLHQPHISMGLDEEDKRFDGILPHAVLTPAIRIFGNSSGDSLDQGKIISRSTILISDDALRPATISLTPHMSNVQPQASERKPGSVEDSFSQLSKKRKLSPRDPPLTKPRLASPKRPSSPSASVAPRTTHSHGQMRFTDYQETNLAKILTDVEKGNTYEHVIKKVNVAVPKTQTTSMKVVPSQQPFSSPKSNQQIDHNIHWLQDILENEQNEQQLEKGRPSGTPQYLTAPATQQADNDASRTRRSAASEGDTICVKLEEKEKETAEQQVIAGQSTVHATDKKIKDEPED